MAQTTRTGQDVTAAAETAVGFVQTRNYQMRWSHKYPVILSNNITFGTADTTPPTVTVVSPTPGVSPGSAGGFPADFQSARDTEVVLQITDVAPGLSYVAVFATFDTDSGALFEPVYRRTGFVGKYSSLSSQRTIANGLELHLRRSGGWLTKTSGIAAMRFDVDAVDLAGNISS